MACDDRLSARWIRVYDGVVCSEARDESLYDAVVCGETGDESLSERIKEILPSAMCVISLRFRIV